MVVKARTFVEMPILAKNGYGHRTRTPHDANILAVLSSVIIPLHIKEN